MTTSDKTIQSLYLYEKYVKPLEIEAEKAQAKFRPKEYEWSADYGDGKKKHTEKIIEVKEEKDWIDNIFKAVPPTDYAKWKALERDIHAEDQAPVASIDFMTVYSVCYFFIFYQLPFWLILYIA